ncbi:MAG: TIGR04552 family protein, partial [Deltaproteobacteria bacterium]|nr:TIGR04552 family protein [Deltaproteobacteria bacterium]
NLFLAASGASPVQPKACTLLKVLHVLTHLDARELYMRLPVSERSLFEEVEVRVREVVDHMRSIGFPIEQFQSSTKSRGSTVTKILSKDRATAAQVYDRLRFRIVSREMQDIVPILFYLKKRMIPFNCIIAEESRNNLVPTRELLPGLAPGSEDLQVPLVGDRYRHFNEFTHPQFRVISFVADIPHRVDRLLEGIDDPTLSEYGKLVFVPAEFQLFDLRTWEANEEGPANHEAYKARQRAEVWRRLMGPDPLEKDPSRILVNRRTE